VDEGDIRCPADLLKTARRKAAVFGTPRPGQLVLAADTGVFVEGRHLGKPENLSHAAEMLRALSGRWHSVFTGLLLRSREQTREALVETRVRFRALTEGDIAWYLGGEEVMDKAGAYAVQGRAAAFVERIEGEHTNVMGLPMGTLYRMLRELGGGPNSAAMHTEGGT